MKIINVHSVIVIAPSDALSIYEMLSTILPHQQMMKTYAMDAIVKLNNDILHFS
mgnify:CR=1 FL=1